MTATTLLVVTVKTQTEEDEIQAFLGVGNLAGDTDLREVFNQRDFNQEWQTFAGTEVYDFATAYEAVTLRIEGVDQGVLGGQLRSSGQKSVSSGDIHP